MSSALYPKERGVLCIFATVDEPMTALDVRKRMRAGAAPHLGTGISSAIKTLDALGYVEVVGFEGDAPSVWRATSFGRLAHEAMA